MAYKEVYKAEIAEVVRRWQAGASRRHIGAGTGLSRPTVRRYIEAAMGVGLCRDGPAPGEEQLTRLAAMGIAGPNSPDSPVEVALRQAPCRYRSWVRASTLLVLWTNRGRSRLSNLSSVSRTRGLLTLMVPELSVSLRGGPHPFRYPASSSDPDRRADLALSKNSVTSCATRPWIKFLHLTPRPVLQMLELGP